MQAAVCAAAIALLAIGCGGGGDDGPTKEEFIKRGDAICSRAESRKNAALEAAVLKMRREHETLDSGSEEGLVSAVALPPIAAMTAQLGKLEAPSGDEGEAEAIVAGFEESIARIKADPGVVLTGADPFAKADGLAKAYGFGACAEI